MFIYNDKEYEKIWFTSDEHYGSDRHILLSGRLDFQDISKERKIRDLQQALYDAPDLPETLRNAMIQNFTHSVYGLTMGDSRVDKMNGELIYRHNMRVGHNDLVFHLGDFGDYEYASKLNGSHILIVGNYEINDRVKMYKDSQKLFRRHIMSHYNFIDVLTDYYIDTRANDNVGSNALYATLFSDSFKSGVNLLYLTHKPSDCKFNKATQMPEVLVNGDIIMNLFGHIHDKCKVKRFGLNVGVDCHHYYPVSQEEVEFYLTAIRYHYDNEVFC